MTTPYKRLTRPGSLVRGMRVLTQSVWMGPDHLLSVIHNGYTEDYRRFYFKDIQALIIHKKERRRIVYGIMWGLIVLTFASVLAFGIHDQWPNPALFILGGLAAVFALAFIINIAMGPTCATYVQTAVQTERLALCRWRSAQRALARIREAVVVEQGALDPVVLSQHVATVPAGGVLAASPVVSAERSIGLHWHAAAFGVLLVDAIVSLLQLTWPASFLTIAGTFVFMAQAATSIVAVIRQRNSVLPLSLKRLTWLSVIYGVVSYFVSIVISTVMAILHPAAKTSPAWRRSIAFWTTGPSESPLLAGVLIVFMIIAAGLGVMGCLRLLRYRHARAAAGSVPAPMPPPPLSSVKPAEPTTGNDLAAELPPLQE